jgi:hypothetical protein
MSDEGQRADMARKSEGQSLDRPAAVSLAPGDRIRPPEPASAPRMLSRSRAIGTRANAAPRRINRASLCQMRQEHRLPARSAQPAIAVCRLG